MTDVNSNGGTPEGLPLSQERQARAREYARINRRLGIIEGLLSAILLGWLIIGGWGESLVRVFNLPAVPGAVVYFALIYLGYRLIFWPFGYYRGFVLAGRYGLSNQGFGGWLADQAKGIALVLLPGAAAVAALYWFIAIQPGLWWLLAWGLMVAVSFVLSYLAPVLIVPLFFKMKQLADSALKESLEKLARKAGVTVAGVYAIEFSSKTNTANAAMMGAGRTRRIAVSDTLLKSYTPDEIEVVIAHELGHVKNRDFARLLSFQSAAMLMLFWLTGIIAGAMLTPLGFAGPGDAAGMPLLALIMLALSLLFMPVSNTYVRRREQAADDFALRLTGKPEAFVSMITRLTDQNLAEAEPGRWTERLFNDHPGYRSRVEHARRFEKPGVQDHKP